MIISGGEVDVDLAARLLYDNKDNVKPEIIAADRGLIACRELWEKPKHIVGDFDSAGEEALAPYLNDPEVEIHRFKPEKDWTDTEIAVELAIKLGWDEITILGATGTRLDHVLGNIQILALAESKGAKACILDANNRIRVHSTSFRIRRDEQWGKYVSLFAIGGDVHGLTLRGFKYEVEDFTLGSLGSRAVSNEITADEAEVSFADGMVVVIESRD